MATIHEPYLIPRNSKNQPSLIHNNDPDTGVFKDTGSVNLYFKLKGSDLFKFQSNPKKCYE